MSNSIIRVGEVNKNLATLANDDKTRYFLFLIFFFNGTAINWYNVTDLSLVIVSAVSFFYLFIYKRESVDLFFVLIIFYWISINFLSLIFNGSEKFSFFTFGGSILKLFIGYSFFKIFQLKFVRWYLELVSILAMLSIPFFIIQLLNPESFYNFPINFIEDIRASRGDWNVILFNFSPNDHAFRNSGFAGEPGTFGYYIGLAMIFDLLLNKGAPTHKFFILLLIGLTTLSTTFYLSLFLFGFYFINKSSNIRKFAWLLIFLIIAFLAYQLPFIGDKIGSYLHQSELLSNATLVKSARVNRISTFNINVKEVLHYPFGYGVNRSTLTTNVYGEDLDGTNDISRVAIRFGIVGFLFFLIIYFRLFNKLGSEIKGACIFPFIVFMYIASNSMERDYFAMGIFWLHFLLPRQNFNKVYKIEQ